MRDATAETINTFPTRLAIRSGDRIGVDLQFGASFLAVAATAGADRGRLDPGVGRTPVLGLRPRP